MALLRKSAIVRRVEYNYYHISVWFKDGFKERWALHSKKGSLGRVSIPRTNLLLRTIPTFSEFETRPFDDERNSLVKPHFIVQYSDVAQGGFADIRLKIHEVLQSVLEEGWINPRYPDEALEQDRRDLDNKQWETYAPSLNMVNLYGGIRTPGFVTAINFMRDAGSVTTGYRSSLRDGWANSRLMRKAIEHLLRMGRDITRTRLIRTLCTGVRLKRQYPAGFRFNSPLFYKAMFTKIFKLKCPTILDIVPDLGASLIGTGMMKGIYYYNNVGDFGHQATGLGRYLGVETKEDDGSKKADVGLTGLRAYSVEDAMRLVERYKSRCGMLLIPMTPWGGDELKQKLPPKRILRARLGHKQHKIYDQLFVY